MKINWFSPVPPSSSAAAKQTAALLPALARRAEVTLWAHEPTWSPALESYAHVRHYVPDAMPWTEINAADITVYQLANDAEEHGAIWQVLRQHPGIVILHDLNLQPLFDRLRARNEIAAEEYAQLMEFHRGDEQSAASLLHGAVIENAVGVVLSTKEEHPAIELPTVSIPFAGSEDANAAAEVDALFHLIEKVNANRSQEAAYWLAGRAGHALGPWFTELGGRVLLPRLAAAVHDLCGAEEAPASR